MASKAGKLPATKADLDQVAMAALSAIENESEDTRGYVEKRIKQTENKILDAIANLENTYALDQHVMRTEEHLRISG